MSESLVKLVYSEYANEYSKKNWVSNVPLWSTLSENEKQWWTDFVKNIRGGFRKDLRDNIPPLVPEDPK